MGANQLKLRRTWPQRLLLAANVCVVMACLATAFGLRYIDRKVGSLHQVSLSHVLSEAETSGGVTGAPTNILIVGIDSAENLAEDDPVRSGRSNVGLLSDTIMVLRVDPGEREASLLSIPRDLWVPIAGQPHRQRINTSLSAGGADVLIQTVQTYFNIRIHHYAQLDFAGFQSLVRIIDGVPVAFDSPARDLRSGLFVEQPGCVVLDEHQALAYARSRAFEYFEDGEWRIDGTGDLGRITRQQDFIKRALGRAISRGLRNPITLTQLIDAGLQSVTVDHSLDAADLGKLGLLFQGFTPDELNTYSLPTRPETVNGFDILQLVEEDAQVVLNVFRGVDGAESVPSIVRVRILNGSGAGGEAAAAAEALRVFRFDVVGTEDAESFDNPTTIIRYGSNRREDALLLARYLNGEAVLERSPGHVGGVIDLVTGDTFAGVRDTPRAAADLSIQERIYDPEVLAVSAAEDPTAVVAGRSDTTIGEPVSAAAEPGPPPTSSPQSTATSPQPTTTLQVTPPSTAIVGTNPVDVFGEPLEVAAATSTTPAAPGVLPSEGKTSPTCR